SQSNAMLLKRWMADHGASEVPNNVRNGLANLKSQLRKRVREGRPIGGKVVARTKPTQPRSPESNGLDALEEQIGDILSMARNIDREGLAEVIALLRRARTQVAWKMGE